MVNALLDDSAALLSGSEASRPADFARIARAQQFVADAHY
jgi:hypothetical protein